MRQGEPSPMSQNAIDQLLAPTQRRGYLAYPSAVEFLDVPPGFFLR